MFSVYRDPVVVKNFITREYCDFLIDYTQMGLKSSSILNLTGGVDDKIRMSKSMTIETDNHPIVDDILSKVSKLLKVPKCNLENLQVTKYETGGYYKPHLDSKEPETIRPHTVIIYLNDDYNGGETCFPKLNKTFKLNRGDALVFDNYDTMGNYTLSSLHSGEMVTSGEKWICTSWVSNRLVLGKYAFFS